jgi:hypothetical protein
MGPDMFEDVTPAERERMWAHIESQMRRLSALDSARVMPRPLPRMLATAAAIVLVIGLALAVVLTGARQTSLAIASALDQSRAVDTGVSGGMQ